MVIRSECGDDMECFVPCGMPDREDGECDGMCEREMQGWRYIGRRVHGDSIEIEVQEQPVAVDGEVEGDESAFTIE